MNEEEKRSIGSYLSGALEAAGVTLGYVPHALGSAILGGAEGLLSGFNWSDREGVPFWNSEEAKQGFVNGIQRYAAPTTTPEGAAAANAWNDTMIWVDKPFAMFGEGTEELAKRLGASDENAEIAFIACGTASNQAKEANRELEKLGVKTKVIKLRTIRPFPEKELLEALEGVKYAFVPEFNVVGWLANDVKAKLYGKCDTEIVAGPQVAGGMSMPAEAIIAEVMEKVNG